MNTVLDDTMKLSLANGERLSLKPNIKILLELDNLQSTSPPIISRCGIIYFE